MKHFFTICAMMIALSFTAKTQIPRTFSYQGVLTDGAGSPKPDSTYGITFSLYTNTGNGAPIWSEIDNVPVRRGLFSVVLGANNPIPYSIQFNQPYWLGIKIGNDPELTPRIALSSVAYSLNSSRADTSTVAMTALGDTNWSSSGVNVYKPYGNVGIGTKTPATRLEVAGSTQFYMGSTYTILASDVGNTLLRLGLGFDTLIDAGVIQASNEGVTFNKKLVLNPNGGNVGIGLTNPTTKLEVGGTLKATAFVGDGSGITGITGGTGGISNAGSTTIVADNDDNSIGDIAFNIGTGGSATKLTVANNGNVGIGTANPATRLQVSSNTVSLIGSSYAIAATNASDPALRLNLGYDSLADAAVIQASQEGVTFSKNLLLNPNAGNVGIGTTSPEALLTVKGNGSFRGNHIAYFENTSPADGDGIAIQIDQDHTNRFNNFVTFYNGSATVTGRIEGFDYDNNDWVDPTPFPDFNPTLNLTLQPIDQWFGPGILPSPTLTGGELPTLGCNKYVTANLGTLGSVTWCTDPDFKQGAFPTLGGGAGKLPRIFNSPFLIGIPPLTITMPPQQQITDLICWGLTNGESDILPLILLNGITDGSGLDLYLLDKQAKLMCKDEGVTYGSKGADYAEWLEKSDPSEDIRWGQIVGVRGGKISKSTKGAEQIMIVSRAPVVLGNHPADGNTGNYERVAFMGQVHAVVHGTVHAGDYILASGNDDGIGIAVSPDNLRVEHLGRIVGRAWEDSPNGAINFVNVVVGVHHEAATHLITSVAQDQAAMKAENESLHAQIAELKAGQARLSGILARLENRNDPTWAPTSVSHALAPNASSAKPASAH